MTPRWVGARLDGRNRPANAAPPPRDRVVDAARAFGVVVVVLWHWVLSVTHRTGDGSLEMANPIHVVPGGWLLTWVLQVMPVFFVVGGYANLARWQRSQALTSTAGFVGARLRRLLLPAAVWAGVWLSGELVAASLPGPHRWMWEWFPGYLAPLWFLGVYAVLVLTVPVTATLHARYGVRVLVVLAALIAAGSVLGRGAGWVWAVWATAAVVWIFCHQVGYAWRTYDLGRQPLSRRLAVTGGGLVVLVGLTGVGGFPRSMVSTVGDPESNIFPTTAAIAALAVFQLGLLALVTPAADRLLERPRLSKPVAAVNAVALTVFLWHMSAYLVVLEGYERSGAALPTEPTAAWWAQRWLWSVAPAAVLAVLVAVFAPVEAAARRPRGRQVERPTR